MTQAKHASIIGAGLAGAALALFLKRLGITSAIYEGHDRLATMSAESQGHVRIGGGFQVAPNGMNVLKALGLSDALTSRSSLSEYIRFVNAHGKDIARFRNGRLEVNGVTTVTTTRSTLVGVLLDEVERQAIPVHCGKRLKDVQAGPDGVVACFEDGSTAESRFLVGADGMHSRTRQAIFPDAPKPIYQGVLGQGGSVTRETVDSLCPLPKDTLTFVHSSVGQFGYAEVGEGLCNWWSHLPEPKEPTKAELAAMTTEVLRQRLVETYGQWAEPVPTFLRQTEHINPVPIYSLPALPAWYRGNVVLVGDACHGMSPSSGLGASLAFEDAMYLAMLLRDASEPNEHVFAAFERQRRPRTDKVAALARKRDARERKLLGPVRARIVEGLMSLAMPLVAERSLRGLYEYRIAWSSE